MPMYTCPNCLASRDAASKIKVEAKIYLTRVVYECGSVLQFYPRRGTYKWDFKCQHVGNVGYSK